MTINVSDLCTLFEDAVIFDRKRGIIHVIKDGQIKGYSGSLWFKLIEEIQKREK